MKYYDEKNIWHTVLFCFWARQIPYWRILIGAAKKEKETGGSNVFPPLDFFWTSWCWKDPQGISLSKPLPKRVGFFLAKMGKGNGKKKRKRRKTLVSPVFISSK